MGFKRWDFDEAVFIMKVVILVAYVDDLLLFGPPHGQNRSGQEEPERLVRNVRPSKSRETGEETVAAIPMEAGEQLFPGPEDYVANPEPSPSSDHLIFAMVGTRPN